MKTAKLIPLLALSAALTAPSAHASSNDQERTLVVSASVRGYCQVSQDSSALTVDSGFADLGLVSEVCNSATGYRVMATFSNLKEATVFDGSDSDALAEDGTVTFDRPEASKIRHRWQVRDAVLRDSSAPVLMQISVSPL